MHNSAPVCEKKSPPMCYDIWNVASIAEAPHDNLLVSLSDCDCLTKSLVISDFKLPDSQKQQPKPRKLSDPVESYAHR